MKRRKLAMFLLSAVVASSALFGACKTEKPVDTPKGNEVVDPFGKYDPPINQTGIRIKTTWMTLDEGEDENNNAWSRALKEHLGINFTQKWTAPDWGAPFDEKVNLAITTDDMPDIIPVYTTLFFRTVENGRAADITDVYKKYASDKVKAMMEMNGGSPIKTVTYDGKIMGLATPPSNDSRNFLWLRKDWMDKLKLQAPKTLDDLFAIAKAFATQDPNGNGKQDEIGLPLTKTFFGGAGDAKKIFNAYGLFPQTWIEKDGKLVRGETLPENKELLKKLAQLYKEGVISKEFAIKDQQKEVEQDYAADKVGIAFGGYNHVGAPALVNSHDKVGAQWEVYEMPTLDGKPLKAQFDSRISQFVAVSKKNKNPEAAIKIVNLQMEIDSFNPKYVKDNTFNMSKTGKMVFWCKPAFGFDEPNKGVRDAKAVFDALAKNDPAGLNLTNLETYNKVKDYEANKTKDNWDEAQMFKKGGAAELFLSDKYKDAAFISPAWGPETPAWIQSGQDLATKVQDYFIKAVTTGDVDGEFQKWLDYFNKQGGADAAKEYNDWYAKNKK